MVINQKTLVARQVVSVHREGIFQEIRRNNREYPRQYMTRSYRILSRKLIVAGFNENRSSSFLSCSDSFSNHHRHPSQESKSDAEK